MVLTGLMEDRPPLAAPGEPLSSLPGPAAATNEPPIDREPPQPIPETPVGTPGVTAEPTVVMAYPVQELNGDVAVAYPVGRGYYPEPLEGEYYNLPMRIADHGGGAGLEGVVGDGFPLRGRWSDGLFSCFRQVKPTCLMATCCSCILISQLAERVRWSVGYRPMMLSWTFLYLCIWVAQYHYPDAAVFPVMLWIGLTWSLVWHLRCFVRHRYDIPGNCLLDMLAAILCNCCSLAQMARHVFYYRACCDESCECGPPIPLP